jgi:hypothetical protein
MVTVVGDNESIYHRYTIADEALETAATKLDQFCAFGQWDLNSKFIDAVGISQLTKSWQ